MNKLEAIFARACLLTIVLIIASCQPEQAKSSAVLERLEQQLPGIYNATLPCDACDGKFVQIMVTDRKTYQARVQYQGSSIRASNFAGDITMSKSGILTFDGMPNDMRYFSSHFKGLLLLDRKKKEIRDPARNMYVFERWGQVGSSGPNDETLQAVVKRNTDRFFNGVDFYAVGQEPFWTLDLDFERDFAFSSMSDIAFSAPAVAPMRAQNSTLERYTIESELGSMVIHVLEVNCTDNMSGEDHPYRVAVEIQRGVDSVARQFRGCGSYVLDPAVEGAWQLVRYDGATLSDEQFAEGLPLLRLRLSDKVVLGHDGCNNVRGAFKAGKATITFTKLAGTLRSCPDHEVGTELFRRLSATPWRYALSQQLVLLEEDDEVFAFDRLE